ncbi:MAG: aromatic amino acid ammonia-lyase [Myxococcota bacterium]
MTSSIRNPEADSTTAAVVFGREPIKIDDVVRVARGECMVLLDEDPVYRQRLRSDQSWLMTHQRSGGAVYGLTTGVGASVENQIPESLRDEMPLHLVRLHGVGTGRILSEEETAACVAARIASLAQGYSGVREELLERLCLLLNQRLLPRIPSEGSVGASGDLTPLSYLASTVIGEREVTFRGEIMSAQQAHQILDLKPLSLLPKESLSIMNGTSMMTGLACLAFERAGALAALASTLTAMTSEGLHGNPEHFDRRIFEIKPHPGSRLSAAWIRAHLEGDVDRPVARLQDRYSVRCAPHVIGVLLDALSFAREMLEIEVNGADDNPLVDADAGEILHGGNFYGGHVCFVMDGLKNAVANVADLLDRQLALLCHSETSGGLPNNLVAGTDVDQVVHHGFKAMHISASALTAEALKLTFPASAFSRSTESHNQDKVSMGTIAARDCLRILELAETVAAILLLANCQVVDLRARRGIGPASLELHAVVRQHIPMVQKDRRQDQDIERVLSMQRNAQLPTVGSFTAAPPAHATE